MRKVQFNRIPVYIFLSLVILKRLIGSCKWVFHLKFDSDGNIVRFKVRLVGRGFSQVYGIDYLETFAPVAKLTSVRILFAIASVEDLEIHQIDFIIAFLGGELEEEI